MKLKSLHEGHTAKDETIAVLSTLEDFLASHGIASALTARQLAPVILWVPSMDLATAPNLRKVISITRHNGQLVARKKPQWVRRVNEADPDSFEKILDFILKFEDIVRSARMPEL